MTALHNSPAAFAVESLEGFVQANADRVLGVHGGVVRAAASPEGQVAIVMGGGSGHYPAFAGWVGPGFGHGAVCGNVFASPSATQIVTVSRAAQQGGGVLFVPINYAGDILHFGEAAQQLRAEGLDVRMVAVTDDIASGSFEERSKRRGIAGSFIVLKIAGAAAERGAGLDELEHLVTAVNEATRSFGVAFSGCTLPGAEHPLFELPPGRLAVGLGIHGEPGIREAELGSADEVADLLVDGLLAERPAEQGRRVAVLVNGLGATKYDELNLVFRRVSQRLEAAGMALVAPVVGEQVTSLDMAGVSVSITYLDEETEQLWLAPADTVSFSRAVSTGAAPAESRRRRLAAQPSPDGPGAPIPPADADSRAAAHGVVRGLQRALQVLTEQQAYLGEIDSVAGDGDHGNGMVQGATAALAAARTAVQSGAGAGYALRRAAEAWSDEAGGTSGALWGSGLKAAAAALGDSGAVGPGRLTEAVRSYVDAIVGRGGAQRGDKTMLDALLPFADTLTARIEAGDGIAQAWAAAAAAAHENAELTAGYAARRGRSRTHGEASIGVPDPGAMSFALVVEALLGWAGAGDASAPAEQ